MTDTIFTYQDGSRTTSFDTTLLSSSYGNNKSTLTEVWVGTIVTSLGVGVFETCTKLTTVTFDAGSIVSSLRNNCFYNCSNLGSIVIPSSTKTLEDNCFRNCFSLTTITIPSSVTSLGLRCFQTCTLLASVTFESTSKVTTLGGNCFAGCQKLLSIIIPSLVTTLGNNVFQNCTSLRTFTFDNQNNLTSVGTNTFLNDPAMSVTYYMTPSEATLTPASQEIQAQLSTFPITPNYIYNAGPSCFNKGTNILTEKGYVRIEDLKKGDLVKTYLHGYKEITKIGKGFGKNNNENKLLNMHIYENVNFEEPLIMTGGHSILVDDLRIYKEENEKWFHGGTYKIDDKYLLLATVSKDFKEIKDGSEFEYYHLVLENEDENGQYGIWANNVLTESASMKWFVKECLKELS